MTGDIIRPNQPEKSKDCKPERSPNMHTTNQTETGEGNALRDTSGGNNEVAEIGDGIWVPASGNAPKNDAGNLPRECNAFERALTDQINILKSQLNEALSALKDVSEGYQKLFDVMPVAWQTYDNIVTSTISSIETR